MLKIDKDINLVIDVSSDIGKSNQSENNTDFLNQNVGFSVNPITDNELYEFKNRFTNISYCLFFFNTFNPLISGDTLDRFIDSNYIILKSDINNLALTIQRQSLITDYQYYAIPRPYNTNLLPSEVLINSGLISQSFVTDISLPRPTFTDLPIYYSSFAIPFKSKQTTWVNNYNDKPYLYASGLIIEYFDSNDPIRQKLIMTTKVPVSERYCDTEVLSESKTLRPLFNLDKTKEGYSISFTKFGFDELYAKYYFYDAANNRRIPMIPASVSTNNRRWVISNDEFNVKYEYSKIVLNKSLLQYDTLLFDGNDYTIETPDIDLFELVIDTYWSDKKVPIFRPTQPVPVSYFGTMVKNNSINKDISINNTLFEDGLLDTMFRNNIYENANVVNTVFKILIYSLFTNNELKYFFGSDFKFNRYDLINDRGNLSIESNLGKIRIQNQSNKQFKLKDLYFDTINLTGNTLNNQSFVTVEKTRLDQFNRYASIKLAYGDETSRLPDYPEDNIYIKFVDLINDNGFMNVVLGTHTNPTYVAMRKADIDDFFYDVSHQYGELEIPTDLRFISSGNTFASNTGFNFTNTGTMVSSGFYIKPAKEWSDADKELVYKREVESKFETLNQYTDYLLNSTAIKYVILSRNSSTIGRIELTQNTTPKGQSVATNTGIRLTVNGITYQNTPYTFRFNKYPNVNFIQNRKFWLKNLNEYKQLYDQYIASLANIDPTNGQLTGVNTQSINIIKNAILTLKPISEIKTDYINLMRYYHRLVPNRDQSSLFDNDFSVVVNMVTNQTKSIIEPSEIIDLDVKTYFNYLLFSYNFDIPSTLRCNIVYKAIFEDLNDSSITELTDAINFSLI